MSSPDLFIRIRLALAPPRKRAIRRLAWPDRFVRKLVVVVRANRELPQHVERFIENCSSDVSAARGWAVLASTSQE